MLTTRSASSHLLLLVLICTISIHMVRANEVKGVQREGSCKANRLVRRLHLKFSDHLNKMRKGDTTLRLIDKAASLKKLIKKVEKRKVCLGGTDLERELAKALDIMADVVLVQGCAMNIVRKMQDCLMFSKIVRKCEQWGVRRSLSNVSSSILFRCVSFGLGHQPSK